VNKKRMYVEEILEKRARHPKETPRVGHFVKRLDAIRDAMTHVLADLEDGSALQGELLRYFPMAIVAAVESFFRMAIRDLIDSGAPFLERVQQFKDIKLDMAMAAAIQGRKVTLGEIVSHLLRLNNLRDINASVSVIIGEDFLDHLKNSQLDLPEPGLVEMNEMAGDVFAWLTHLYKLRHIYCHELASDKNPAPIDIARALFAADMLVGCSEVVFWYLETDRQKEGQEGTPHGIEFSEDQAG
jgi:hypothetical protein